LAKIPLTRQRALLLGIYPIQIPTMGKDKHKGPYFLVPIPYVHEEEKEADPSDGKLPSAKLLLDSQGKKIDNPTVQVQPIFNGAVLSKKKWHLQEKKLRTEREHNQRRFE
jgi:hypothetical protein